MSAVGCKGRMAACMPRVMRAIMCCPDKPFGTEALIPPAVATVLSVTSLSRNGPQPRKLPCPEGVHSYCCRGQQDHLPLTLWGVSGELSQLQQTLGGHLMPPLWMHSCPTPSWSNSTPFTPLLMLILRASPINFLHANLCSRFCLWNPT